VRLWCKEDANISKEPRSWIQCCRLGWTPADPCRPHKSLVTAWRAGALQLPAHACTPTSCTAQKRILFSQPAACPPCCSSRCVLCAAPTHAGAPPHARRRAGRGRWPGSPGRRPAGRHSAHGHDVVHDAVVQGRQPEDRPGRGARARRQPALSTRRSAGRLAVPQRRPVLARSHHSSAAVGAEGRGAGHHPRTAAGDHIQAKQGADQSLRDRLQPLDRTR
jgi:hypothetical protein